MSVHNIDKYFQKTNKYLISEFPLVKIYGYFYTSLD